MQARAFKEAVAGCVCQPRALLTASAARDEQIELGLGAVCGGVSGMRRGGMVPTLLLVGGPAAVCNGTVSVVVANPVVVVVHGSQNGESRIARTRTSKRFRKTLMWNRFSLIPTEPIGTNQGPNRLLSLLRLCWTMHSWPRSGLLGTISVIICLNYFYRDHALQTLSPCSAP